VSEQTNRVYSDLFVSKRSL